MMTNANLSVNKGEKITDIHQYRAMINSLLYLMTNRSDIIFSIYLYTQYQADLKESHLITLKRILRYVKGTLNLGLLYSK
jgi:hypothetical protein